MTRHFVTFFSPGTFVAETTEKPIDSWDVDKAVEMAGEIEERHGAKPYGFRFSTRERGENDLDSHETELSGMHYLSGTIETIEEIRNRRDPSYRILIDNMETNHWDRVVTCHTPYRWTQPFKEGDVLVSEYP